MSERSFNQMSDIKEIVYQMLAFIDSPQTDYEPKAPLWWASADQKAIIEKALNKIKDVLEQS